MYYVHYSNLLIMFCAMFWVEQAGKMSDEVTRNRLAALWTQSVSRASTISHDAWQQRWFARILARCNQLRHQRCRTIPCHHVSKQSNYTNNWWPNVIENIQTIETRRRKSSSHVSLTENIDAGGRRWRIWVGGSIITSYWRHLQWEDSENIFI